MNYREYLQSDEWKEKRDRRRTIDGKCAICGSKIDLNVHHLTYENVPNEKTSDLVTLCRKHHVEIESQKNRPGSDTFCALNHMMQAQFCEEFKALDYSGGGNLDFCKIDVVKKYFWPFLKQRIGDTDRIYGCVLIQIYFRNRRYEVILDYIRRKYPPHIVANQTLFSRKMIYKVYERPEMATQALEEELRNKEEKETKINNFLRRK